MGSALSQEESKAIQPHLHGFEPASLASVIWDSLNKVGVDDEMEKMGIDFGTNDEEGQAGVVFWDESGVTQLPRKVFLQVLEYVAEQTIDSYESNYDLDKSPALAATVHKLQLAFAHLRREIQSMKGDEDVSVYRERLDSGVSVEQSDSEGTSIVEELRTRKGSWHWANGEPDDFARLHERRRSSKGIVGVVERLPELRRRYEQESRNSPLGRVRNKLRALSILQRGSVTPSVIPEETDSEQATVKLPNARENSLQRDSPPITPPISRIKIPTRSLPTNLEPLHLSQDLPSP